MPARSWIDRAPAAAQPYLRLMRLDRPIGTWLLLFPCWWSLAMAPRADGFGWRDLWLAALFGIGALVMRGAGCTVNDILDRDIDARVARTRARPIPSGQVSVRQALAFLALQLAVGLAVLLGFNGATLALGAASLVLVFTYPLMKRVTWWPQFFLGLAFNWGALLGWSAVTGRLDAAPVVLWLAGIAWTLGYDTIYAAQDIEDDARIGVKSTARLFGRAAPTWVAAFYAAATVGLAAAGWLAGLHVAYLAGVGAGAAQLAWQVTAWQAERPADSLAKFRSNRLFAWLVLAGFVAGRALA